MDFDLYVLELDECFKYVDLGCQYFGILSVVFFKLVKGKKRGVYVCMIFGDIEFCVKVVNKINNEEMIVIFDFFEKKELQ